MAVSVKISQLLEGGSVLSQDVLPVARGDETFKIAASQFIVNAQNVGVGPGQIFTAKVGGNGSTLQMRTLSGTEGISIVNQGQTLVFSASGQAPSKTKFFGNGVTTTFPLNEANSVNVNNYRVDIDGVLQEPIDDYIINGSNIVFSSAPPLSSKVVVVSNNLVRTFDIIPADNSVTNIKIANNAVTNDKIDGPVSISKGGTNATTALMARSTLGLPLSVHFLPVNFFTRSNANVPILAGTGNFFDYVGSSGNWWRAITGSSSANPWWSGIQTETLPSVPPNTIAVLVEIYLNVNSILNNGQSLHIRKDSTENWGNTTLTTSTPGDITPAQRNAFVGDYIKLYLDPTGESTGSFEAEHSVTIPIYINTTTNSFQWFIMDSKLVSTAGQTAPVYAIRMNLLGYYIQVV